MTYSDYFLRLEKMQRWINNDLTNSSIHAHANFLVAMGVFNYVELLGSFYEHQNNRGNATRRFNFAFQNLFAAPYQQIFNQLQTLTNRGAYDCLRCGMTHEYLIKTYTANTQPTQISFTIRGVDTQAEFNANVNGMTCGLELLPIGSDYHLDIYNPRLIHDLDLAFEEYKQRLTANQGDYQARFLTRCQDIHLENFN